MTSKKAASPKPGKATNLYLRGTDMAKVRELMAFIAGQDERVSISAVVRAALHYAKPDRQFRMAYQVVADADQRLKGSK